MSIRNTSYYGWQTFIHNPQPPGDVGNIFLCKFQDIAFDSQYAYICGTLYDSGDDNSVYWTTWRSDKNFKKIEIIDKYKNFSTTAGFQVANAIYIDLSGGIYVTGEEIWENDNSARWITRKSHITASTTWNTVDHSTGSDSTNTSRGYGVAVDSSGTVYSCGVHPIGAGFAFVVRKSTTGQSGSFSVVLEHGSGSSAASTAARDIAIDHNDTAFAVGTSPLTSSNNSWAIFSCSDAGSTWVRTRNGGASAGVTGEAYTLSIHRSGTIYVAGNGGGGTGGPADFIFSNTSGGSWVSVANSTGRDPTGITVVGKEVFEPYQICVFNFDNASGQKRWTVTSYFSASSGYPTSTNSSIVDRLTSSVESQLENAVTSRIRADGNFIYSLGYSATNGGFGIIRKGIRSANSASIGPMMLTPSFGFVRSELNGIITEGFNLNNISEFPHSSGIFQMKNMVLGTVSQGRAGTTDESIVQKRFIGSFVRVLFPRQDEEQSSRGYDVGRKPGKLSTDWQWGDVIDIEGKGFDSVSLNCVASVLTSGTLDSVLVRVESKPLGDSGFFVDQTVEQTISSSYASEALFRDDILVKSIDYGDLSRTEIGWKIPIDLKNVKQLRISCRQKTGQSDDKNKQFLVIARFVKSQITTNEV